MSIWQQLISDPTGTYTPTEMYLYYAGAAAWLVTYALVIRKIIKEKFVEFPALIIAANVSWELLGGFVLGYPSIVQSGIGWPDLPEHAQTPVVFGGPILLWAWRAGSLMDVFMLISCLRYGAKQTSEEWLKKIWKPMILIGFCCFAAILYTFYLSLIHI